MARWYQAERSWCVIGRPLCWAESHTPRPSGASWHSRPTGRAHVTTAAGRVVPTWAGLQRAAILRLKGQQFMRVGGSFARARRPGAYLGGADPVGARAWPCKLWMQKTSGWALGSMSGDFHLGVGPGWVYLGLVCLPHQSPTAGVALAAVLLKMGVWVLHFTLGF